jgi:hypothetical protein
VNPDDPITLKEAGELYRLTVSTLRAEAGRGRLDIFRIGKRDYTTAAAMREMIRKCQDAARERACTLTRDANSGLSETERASSAQAALSQTVVALKRGFPHTLAKNTNRGAGRTR